MSAWEHTCRLESVLQRCKFRIQSFTQGHGASGGLLACYRHQWGCSGGTGMRTRSPLPLLEARQTKVICNVLFFLRSNKIGD